MEAEARNAQSPTSDTVDEDEDDHSPLSYMLTGSALSVVVQAISGTQPAVFHASDSADEGSTHAAGAAQRYIVSVRMLETAMCQE